MKLLAIVCAALVVAPAAVAAPRHSYSEIREFTLPFLGSLDVDTGGVGSISVQGGDRLDVAVRAEIVGSEGDDFEDRFTVSLVRIDTPSNQIRVSGPRGRSWSVNLAILVPRESGLELRTGVGAIGIADTTGIIRFATGVGAITLSNLGGDVEGEAGVGAIGVTLAGERWDGKGLHVRTRTGAIRIAAPESYSADFDLRTGLGALRGNFPGARGQISGFLAKKLVFTAGSGGPPIRASTGIGEVELSTR
jgi:hypothetical protein